MLIKLTGVVDCVHAMLDGIEARGTTNFDDGGEVTPCDGQEGDVFEVTARELKCLNRQHRRP